MTKAELIEAVQAATAKKHNLSKVAVAELIEETFNTIAKTVAKGGRFQVPGFGTFSVRSRKARQGRNPQTGEPITIKASKTVAFKPAPKLKNKL